uniref:Uncharacterized protein n=1 Tax=Anguilla anguilla TaxID=7936 RepID=A0A0E9SVG3_ANGAN
MLELESDSLLFPVLLLELESDSLSFPVSL